MREQGAAPEGGTSGLRLIDGTAETLPRSVAGCIGCGLPTDNAERKCADCRNTDSKHGTFVSGPGRPCPECGGE